MTSIQPELWVERPGDEVGFYEAAFGARVLHRVGEGEDTVAQLAVGDAAFWVAGTSASLKRLSPRAIDGATSRTLLVVDDPDGVVRTAVAAGATETSPVGDEHDWRLGRIVDPFGHEWEIGRPLEAWPPQATAPDERPSVFRVGGVSYLRIPAPDPHTTAAFYEAVFGWNVRRDRDEPGFDDASGHVIGHFVADLAVAGEAGVRPYVYVERVDDTLAQVSAHGGETVTAPYPEGDLWVATFRDPGGNVVGIWQRGAR